MKRRIIFISFALGLLAVFILWELVSRLSKYEGLAVSDQIEQPETNSKQSPSASSKTFAKSILERRKEAVKMVMSALDTPIAFYGKVIDQHGHPVPNAAVGYSALDTFMAPGTGYTDKSDAEGLFNISGIKGSRLSVNVRKDGYYFIDGKSNSAFSYSGGGDSYFLEPPTQTNPAIFVLHKMGEADPLFWVQRDERISKDGIPVAIDLKTGRISPNGQLRIEAWTNAFGDARSFTWRCQISIPGGGLIERLGDFDFTAPDTGYVESVEFGMPHDAELWSSQQRGEYFARLPDGCFARLSFRMIAGGNHYFVLESFVNPEPGNRNLEFDPDKVIKLQ